MLEVICGGMFSGKTAELHRRLTRHAIAKRKTVLVTADGRYGGDSLTHAGNKLDPRIKVEYVPASDVTIERIRVAMEGADVIGFDEASFYPEWFMALVEAYRDQSTILVACLDQDYLGIPFELTAHLMGMAESVTKLNAVCVRCGGTATMSLRTTSSNERILEGSEESYEAVCRKCWLKAQKNQRFA